MLPKIELPTFSTKLPSTGEKVIYRPFRVKEQRNLLTAYEESKEEVYRVMKECVDACTFNKLSVDNLPSFDIEYLFIQIRMMSIGEMISVDLKCPKCGNVETKSMSLKEAEVRGNSRNNTNIKINEDVYIKMRYPKLEELGAIEDNTSSENVFKMIKGCIEEIYSGDEVSKKGDFTDEELSEWLTDLTDEQFSEIETFIIDSPYLYSEIKNECGKCNTNSLFSLKGVQSFFA